MNEIDYLQKLSSRADGGHPEGMDVTGLVMREIISSPRSRNTSEAIVWIGVALSSMAAGLAAVFALRALAEITDPVAGLLTNLTMVMP